jgi:hypothetical protein
VKWEVDLHDDFVPEYRTLHKDVQDELLAHVARIKRQKEKDWKERK